MVVEISVVVAVGLSKSVYKTIWHIVKAPLGTPHVFVLPESVRSIYASWIVASPIMTSISMVVSVVVVVGRDLIVSSFVDDRDLLVLSGGRFIVGVSAFMMSSSVDVIWRSAMSASVSLPPAAIIAFIAKSDPWSYVVPEGHRWVGLPTFMATKA
jgi:hypothetical protein